MFFSALSLKVLVGLGTLVGASFLAKHYTSKDTNTNTDTLNSKQGEVVVTPLKPEGVVISEPEKSATLNRPEVVVTPEQAAKKEIERLDKEIERLDKEIKRIYEFKGSNSSKLLKIVTNMPLLKEDLKGKYDEWQKYKRKWKDSADINGEADTSEADWTKTNKAVDDGEKEITKLKGSIETNNQNLNNYKKDLDDYTKQRDLLSPKSSI